MVEKSAARHLVEYVKRRVGDFEKASDSTLALKARSPPNPCIITLQSHASSKTYKRAPSDQRLKKWKEESGDALSIFTFYDVAKLQNTFGWII